MRSTVSGLIQQAWCFVLHSEAAVLPAAALSVIWHQWGAAFSWLLTPGGYIKLLLCSEEPERRTAEKKELHPKGSCKKNEGKTLETQVPRLAARGQIVADSAEIGQLRCCFHGPPAFVPITTADLKLKNNKSKRCLILTPSHQYWYQYWLSLISPQTSSSAKGAAM